MCLKSIEKYTPNTTDVYVSCLNTKQVNLNVLNKKRKIRIFKNEGKTFGESYNSLVNKCHQEDFIIANDDIILTPHTWNTFIHDLNILNRLFYKEEIGSVGVRSDFVSNKQNIRYMNKKDKWMGIKWSSESDIINTDFIAPIFSYYNKESWIDFPEINWYSDNIQCLDIIKKQKLLFISRAYVHHVGGQTCGLDANKLSSEAYNWVLQNRKDINLKELFKL